MDDTETLGGFATPPAEWLAAQCFVSVRTARRWRHTGRAPRLVVAWLQLMHWGNLGTLCKAWDGWRMHDEKLHSPEGRWHTPATLRAEHLRMQETASLWVEVRQLRAELLAAREQARQHARDRAGNDGRQPRVFLPPRERLGTHGEFFQHGVRVDSVHRLSATPLGLDQFSAFGQAIALANPAR